MVCGSLPFALLDDAAIDGARGAPQVRAMIRIIAAAAIAMSLVSVSALAQKPPPLDEPDTELRKPPPLGASPTVRPAPYGAPAGGGGRPYASGSGFVVARGRAMTNNHVAGECTRITARNGDRRVVEAGLLATDPHRDLALLSIPADFATPLTFRDTPPVERGESVVTYGFPLAGLLSAGPTLTTGIVSALSGLRDTPLHYTITAPVQPGNSGGPLLDAHGLVIGVVVAKLNAARIARMTGGDIPQNVNFAIKGIDSLGFLGEHGVRPDLAQGDGADLGPTEVGRMADRSTLFLQCYR